MANPVSHFISRLRALWLQPHPKVADTVEDWLERESVEKDYWIQRIMEGMHDPTFAARFQKIATGQLPNTDAFNHLQQAVAMEMFQRDHDNLTEEEQMQVFRVAAQQNPGLYAAMQREWTEL